MSLFDHSDGRRPILLDLFCGAGGAGVGYYEAGFNVIGVDIAPQPNYPFKFVQADALDFARAMFSGADMLASLPMPEDIAVIHASPPCQARSDLQKQSKIAYEEFVPRTRALLQATGLPYVIENVEGTSDVPGAELIDPIMLCGTMFSGLRVLRHRLFESNRQLVAPPHPAKHPLVFTHDKRKAHHGQLDQDTAFVQVTGGGNCTVANKADAMGIDWMTGRELNEAIPPAYTEYIGRHIMLDLYVDQALAA